MSDRASLPDFDLTVTGSPRFPLTALQAHPLQQPTSPVAPVFHGSDEARRFAEVVPQ